MADNISKLAGFFTGRPRKGSNAVAVIGLGRFGTALALELMELGVEVLGIDRNSDIIDELDGKLTHLVAGDSTDETLLRELGVDECERAVVAIGTDIEASILTTSRLVKFQIPSIWAKATSEPHGEILTQLGVTNVISPESDMGRRVAHLIRGRIHDYVPIDADFSIVRMAAPQNVIGVPLDELRLRRTRGVTIIAEKVDGNWRVTQRDTVLDGRNEILVAGTPAQLADFGGNG